MQKIRWENRMVVGAEHLRGLEAWVEDLGAWSARRWSSPGLLRAEGEPGVNAASSVTLEEDHSAPSGLAVRVRSLQGLTPSGHAVVVREALLPLESGNVPGSEALLYLTPADPTEPAIAGGEGGWEEGSSIPCSGENEVERYAPPVTATCAPRDPARALLIGKIQYHRRPVALDEDYLPPCANIGGCATVAALHARFVDRFGAWARELGKAHARILGQRESHAGSRAALELLRIVRPILGAQRLPVSDPTTPTHSWLRRVEGLLDQLEEEARLFLPASGIPGTSGTALTDDDLGARLRALLARHEDLVRRLAEPLGATHELGDLHVIDREVKRLGIAWRSTLRFERSLAGSLAPADAIAIRLRFRRQPREGEVARVHPTASYLDVPEADHHALRAGPGEDPIYELRYRPDARAREFTTLSFFTETEPDLSGVEIARVSS